MNKYEFNGDVCTLTVKHKKFGEFKVIFDSDDYDRVKKFKWYITSRSVIDTYCRANIRSYKQNNYILFHRLITSFLYEIVDHVNGDTLDNRKCNLRDGSNGLNQRNRKKLANKKLPVGVYHCGKKYRARINTGEKLLHLGTFNTAEEAANAYLQFRDSRT